ncbi:MAG: hypothetical protein H2069_07445 [Legionella sp.]|nr:hypothetical protein [Legionella sp.]
MREQHERRDDCCPTEGPFARNGICGPESSYGWLPLGLDNNNGTDNEAPCIPPAFEQIRHVNPYDNAHECLGDCLSCPFISIGNVANAALGTGCSIGLLPVLVIAFCASNGNRLEYGRVLEMIHGFGVYGLRSSLALGASAIAPSVFTLRSLRMLGNLRDQSATPTLPFTQPSSQNPNFMAQPSAQPNGILPEPLGPNILMPNHSIHDSKALESEFLLSVQELFNKIKNQTVFSEKEFTLLLKSLLDAEKKAFFSNFFSSTLPLNPRTFHAVKLELFEKILSPQILPDKIKYCTYSTNTLREGIKSLSLLRPKNQGTLDVPSSQRDQHQSFEIDNQIIETDEADLYDIKNKLKTSLLHYYGRPKNKREDFKNMLALFLIIPGNFESHFSCLFLSCLNGYISDNPRIAFKQLINDAKKHKELGQIEDTFYPSLDNHQKTCNILDLDCLAVDLKKEEFLNAVNKKFFPNTNLFSFFNTKSKENSAKLQHPVNVSSLMNRPNH